MLKNPRARPLSSDENELEINLTPGTKMPAPRRPDKNLEMIACHGVKDGPKSIIEIEQPVRLYLMTLLLPNLSA
jgi:hypothetical protein